MAKGGKAAHDRQHGDRAQNAGFGNPLQREERAGPQPTALKRRAHPFDEDVNNHTVYRGQRIDYYEVLKAGMGDWAKSSWFLVMMASAFTTRAAW